MTDRRRFRILTVADNCTGESLALVADTWISGLRVARKLDKLVQLRGSPETVVSDNGTKLTSEAIVSWADDRSAQAEPLLVVTFEPGESVGLTGT